MIWDTTYHGRECLAAGVASGLSHQGVRQKGPFRILLLANQSLPPAGLHLLKLPQTPLPPSGATSCGPSAPTQGSVCWVHFTVKTYHEVRRLCTQPLSPGPCELNAGPTSLPRARNSQISTMGGFLGILVTVTVAMMRLHNQ